MFKPVAPRRRFLRLLLQFTEISLVVHALHVAAFRVPPRKSEEIPGNIGDETSLLYARIAGPFRSFAPPRLSVLSNWNIPRFEFLEGGELEKTKKLNLFSFVTLFLENIEYKN